MLVYLRACLEKIWGSPLLGWLESRALCCWWLFRIFPRPHHQWNLNPTMQWKLSPSSEIWTQRSVKIDPPQKFEPSREIWTHQWKLNPTSEIKDQHLCLLTALQTITNKWRQIQRERPKDKYKDTILLMEGRSMDAYIYVSGLEKYTLLEGIVIVRSTTMYVFIHTSK